MSILGKRLSLVAATLALAACGGGGTNDAGTDSGSDVVGDLGSDTSIATDAPSDSAIAPDAAMDGGSVSGVEMYTATQDRGLLNITIDHDTNHFATTDSMSGTALSGTFTALPAGFLRFTVTAGCDAPGCVPNATGSSHVPNGTNIHVLEARGSFALVYPEVAMSHPVFAVHATRALPESSRPTTS